MTEKRGLARPDDVIQALVDAQDDLGADAADRFRSRLILILADRVGDDQSVLEAIALARQGLIGKVEA